MEEKKKYKNTNNYPQNTTWKLYQNEPYWKPGWTQVLMKGNQVLLH